MTTFSASEAALEGFRLTRERAGAMLAWCGVYLVGLFAIAALMSASLGPEFVAIARKGTPSSADFDAVAAMLTKSWPAFLLVLLVAVFLMSLLTAGIYRLVLRPGEAGVAHLRLGADELRLTAVNLVLFGIGMACLFTGFLVVAMASTAGPGLAMVAGAAVAAVTIWLGVRLSMVTPMTFAMRRIVIAPAWELTSGRFWPLFGMIVLAVIFYIMVWLLIAVIGVAIVTLAGGQEAMAAGATMGAAAVVGALATIFMQLVLQVLQTVMIYAPFAVAYQQLHGDAPANPLRSQPSVG